MVTPDDKMAASCRITPNEVSERLNVETVALSQKNVGKCYLAECLGWDKGKLDDDRCLREAIMVDYLYDVIEFCSRKGFPWYQIKNVLKLAKAFIEQSAGVKLQEAVKIYQDLAVSNSGDIDLNVLQSFTGFILATYFHHFQLYQLVLTEARNEFVVTAEAEVEPPPSDILPLLDAKPQHIHEYEQRLKVIERNEATMKEDLNQQRESLLNNRTQEKLRLDVEEDTSVRRELLEQIIHDAARNQCETVEKLLQVKVEEKHKTMDFYFEKTSLPRPAELGAPPRTKQPPNQSAKSRISTKTKASMKSTPSKTGKKGSKK